MDGRYVKDIKKEEKMLRINKVILEEIEREELDFFSLFGKVKERLQKEKLQIDENEFGQAIGAFQDKKLIDSEIDREDIIKKPLWKLTVKGIKFMQ